MRNKKASCSLSYGNLEPRVVLTATGVEAALLDTNQVVEVASETNVQTVEAISELKIQVNDQLITLDSNSGTLQVNIGDTLNVVEVVYQTPATDGVFALEGYITKLTPGADGRSVDYTDGRFSSRTNNSQANGNGGSVQGLEGDWTMESGWDRLSINLMHYTETGSRVADRLFIDLHVGEPDLVFDTQEFDEFASQDHDVDEAFELPVNWFNQGDGEFRAYAEADIYRQENQQQILWAGASVGYPGHVDDTFTNTRGEDGFERNFVPREAGTYVIKFSIDPEGLITESNESNNEYEITIRVEGRNEAPVANADQFNATQADSMELDVLANDTDADGNTLSIAEFTQPTQGTLQMNADGKLEYLASESFRGVDSFSYRVTDGQVLSDAVTVSVNVVDSGFEVGSDVTGKRNKKIKLHIDADPARYDHVIISGVPDGAKLSSGKVLKNGDVLVKVKDLSKLKIKPAKHSTEDFTLTVTPQNGDQAFDQFAADLNVDMHSDTKNKTNKSRRWNSHGKADKFSNAKTRSFDNYWSHRSRH